MRIWPGLFGTLVLACLLGLAEGKELEELRDAEGCVRLGMKHRQAGKPKEALLAFNRALEHDQTLVAAWSARAQLFEDQERFSRAVEDLTRAHELQPTDVKILYRRGALRQRKLNDQKGAIADFDLVLGRAPSHEDALHYRGDAKLALGDYRGAIQDFDASIAIDPTFSGVYYCRGCAYSRLSSPGRAIRDFDKAIEIQADWSAFFYERGEARFSLGEYALALEDYEQACKLDPADTDPMFSRAKARWKLGDSDRALADLDVLRKLDPRYPELDSLRSRILLQRWTGRIGSAIVVTIGLVVLFLGLRRGVRSESGGSASPVARVIGQG